MPGPSKLNESSNIPRGAPNTTRLIFHSDPITGLGMACTIGEFLELISTLAPVTTYSNNAAMLANTTLVPGYMAYVVETNSIYLYNGPDPANIDSYILLASGGGSGGGIDEENIGDGLMFEDDKVKLGDTSFPATNPITTNRKIQLTDEKSLSIIDSNNFTIAFFKESEATGDGAFISAKNNLTDEYVTILLSFAAGGAIFSDGRIIKKGIEYNFTDYDGLTDNSLITKKVLTDAIDALDTGGGGGGPAQLRYRFNSSLYTEDEHLFQGPLTALTAVKSYNITSFSFAVKLNDSSTTWLACSDVAAVLSWIAVNITTPTTTFWIRCLVNYGTATGIGEVLITYS